MAGLDPPAAEANRTAATSTAFGAAKARPSISKEGFI
jgi:hypothetical protein